MNSRMAAHHSPRNKRDCAAVGVCAKEIKPELNTLDEADFVRDVANRDYHYLSRFEIAGSIKGDVNKKGSPSAGSREIFCLDIQPTIC